jgi:predicted DNA-binding transcriptional regulator AlpA
VKPFITTAEVAQLVGLSRNTFLAKREELAEKHGFPDPMPTSLCPLRWRRDRVEAWIAEQGLPRPLQAELPPRPMGPNVVLLEEARRA